MVGHVDDELPTAPAPRPAICAASPFRTASKDPAMPTARTAACAATGLLALGLVAGPVGGPAAAGPVPFADVSAPGTTLLMAADHRVHGSVLGTNGKRWDNVQVSATPVGSSTVAASDITYGGSYELYLGAGVYRIAFHDLSKRVPDLTYPGDVTVTASGETSLGVTQLTHGTATNTSRPTLQGAARVGERLTVAPGTWNPAVGLGFSYLWLLDGAKSATGAGATVPTSWLGKTLQVTVTGSATAWSAGTARTTEVVVGKARTTLRAKGPADNPRPGAGFTVTARVTDPSTDRPAGVVTVKEGGKRLGKASVNAKGVAKVALAGLKRGKHSLVLTLPGSRYAAAARDTLTVSVSR